MNKSELIDAVAKHSGETKATTARIIDSLTETLKQSAKSGETVSLHGVFQMEVVRKEARTARNPATGATINVPAKNAVKFKALKSLTDAANGNR